jgi:hypothetical protein
VITETDKVAKALDDAARRWPEDAGSRSKLLLRLLEEGHHSVIGEREARAQARREAVAHTSGALTGAFADAYLTELREDWPE